MLRKFSYIQLPNLFSLQGTYDSKIFTTFCISYFYFRSVLPTLTDHAVREQLSSTSQQFNTEISELHSALIRAKPACQGLGLDAAKQLIADLQEELKEFERAVESHKLRPLPDDTPERGAQQLANSSKLVNQGSFFRNIEE